MQRIIAACRPGRSTAWAAGFAVALSLVPASDAMAQVWPAKPVRLVVPFPSGAAPDVVARLIADRLSRGWGQSVYVENRPGAGGIPGMSALARAPADGYTVGFVPAAAAVLTPLLYKNPQYDVERDIVPVAAIGTSPMMVVVPGGSAIRSVDELAREGKQRPGTLNFAAAQAGSVPHLTGEMLGRAGGFRMFTVPYAGSPAATNAVLAGEAAVTIDGIPALIQHVKAGKLRALAVTSSNRLPGLENVPTVAESLPGFESIGWFALFAPAGTPEAVIGRINADVNRLLEDKELVGRLADLGVYPMHGGAGDLRAFVRNQQAVWKGTVQELALQPQ